MFKSLRSPSKSGAGKRKEAYSSTAFICLLRVNVGWRTSMVLAHRALAKGDPTEQTVA